MNGLRPITPLPFRSFGAKIDINRAVLVDDHALVLATDAGEFLVGLDHRARLVVIDDD